MTYERKQIRDLSNAYMCYHLQLSALEQDGSARFVLVAPALFANGGEWEDFKSRLDVLPGLQLVNMGGVLL